MNEMMTSCRVGPTSGGFINTPPPHEEKPQKCPDLPSIEDVLSVGDRHDTPVRVTSRLEN